MSTFDFIINTLENTNEILMSVEDIILNIDTIESTTTKIKIINRNASSNHKQLFRV